jgi:sulfite exporter TauE/SafE
MVELDASLLAAAWLTGLAGSGGPCLGMCGGIVGALGLRQRPGWQGLGVAAAAHAGRVLGYALAGALVGFAGAAAFGALFGTDGVALLRIGAAVLVAAVGLQLLLGRPLLAPLERAGARFWRRLAPLLRGLLPPRNALQAVAVGALWGWLPCGLVYAQLSVAAVAGGALQGAALMATFGLGTSVGLTLLSALLQSLGLARLPRRAAGALLLVFAASMAAPLLLTATDAPHVHAHGHSR